MTFAGCSAAEDVPAPLIASLVPDYGPAGRTISIRGSYFCAQPDPDEEGDPSACKNTGTVSFDGVPATVAQYNDKNIMVEVPVLPPGAVDVQLVVVARPSNRVVFVVE